MHTNGPGGLPAVVPHVGEPPRVAPRPVFDRVAREEAEDAFLVPGATRAQGAGSRAVEEAPDPWRTCFERDYDRITHSSVFRRLAGKIAASGKVLPGSIAERRTHCGHVGCKCMADPPQPHGPYFQWTRKVEKKTVGRWLSPE